jgi:DNA-binding MarR family transcriptional regulator
VALDTGAVAAVQRELTVFARRTRALSARLHPELPFVAYSMLSHLAATGGCRSVDLVSVYRLDKSTVSRQIADLERRGLVRRAPAPAGGRAQLLTVTDEGAALLADAARRQRAELDRRLADWSAEEVAEFARLLSRYNGD